MSIGPIRDAAYKGVVQLICGYSGAEVVEMNIQKDHIHLIAMVPPKVAISDLMGRLKGQTAIKTFKQFPHLRQKPYWGNKFGAKDMHQHSKFFDAEMILKYVKYQEEKERYIEQLTFGF